MDKKKVIKATAAVTGIVAGTGALLFAFSNIVYDQVFTAKSMARRKSSFVLEPAEKEKYLKNPASIHDDRTWFACMDPTEEVISSRSGETLHAEHLIPEKESHVWCLCIHGWTSCPQNVGIPVRHFYEKGFHVLIPHMRAHGKSEHKNVTMGWFDRFDMLDWINFILEKDPQAEIFLIGVSMGSATVMMTAGEDLPPNVKCLIADCGYTSVWDQMDSVIHDMFHLPARPLLDAMRVTTKIRAGYDIKKASSVEQLKKCKTPILFIHGEEDDFVPYHMLQQVYDAAENCEKEMLSIPDAAHANSWDIHPELYWKTADAFIEKHLTAENCAANAD